MCPAPVVVVDSGWIRNQVPSKRVPPVPSYELYRLFWSSWQSWHCFLYHIWYRFPVYNHSVRKKMPPCCPDTTTLWTTATSCFSHLFSSVSSPSSLQRSLRIMFDSFFIWVVRVSAFGKSYRAVLVPGSSDLWVFYYRKTYALVSNQVCKPGFCIRRRSGTHVIPTLARGE